MGESLRKMPGAYVSAKEFPNSNARFPNLEVAPPFPWIMRNTKFHPKGVATGGNVSNQNST